ncbi:MAG: hypothetical protein C0475_03535 [Planctomyces sp.]|nr:hypothetical protein [Planctomyces sp.]MBA4039681.1 hypothetical protein [Planctomyces sp.]
MPTTRLIHTLLLVPLTLLPGCVLGSKSTETLHGQFVSASTLAEVQPGQGKATWLIGLLGQPDSKTPQHDGSELWRWEYRREKVSIGYLIFVFEAVNKELTRVTTYAKIRDGVVESVWQEQG